MKHLPAISHIILHRISTKMCTKIHPLMLSQRLYLHPVMLSGSAEGDGSLKSMTLYCHLNHQASHPSSRYNEIRIFKSKVIIFNKSFFGRKHTLKSLLTTRNLSCWLIIIYFSMHRRACVKGREVCMGS